MHVQFGECVFDRLARKLSRNGKSISLTPKAFQLLDILLERRPQAVSRQDLHDVLWRGTFVSHTSLARLVTELRKAVGDHARTPRVVRTVRRFGYAFAADAVSLGTEAASGRSSNVLLIAGETVLVGSSRVAMLSAALDALQASEPLRLVEGENVLGRSRDCVVRIDGAKVSRLHARVLVAGGRAVLEDLASKNGTFVNGERIAGPVRLSPGDQVCLGSTVLFFCSHNPGSTETSEP